MIINISKQAENNLLKMLSDNNYSCVRFHQLKSCCGNVLVDILLDDIKKNDVIYEINNLTVVYDKNLSEKVKSIEVIFKDNTFMMKITPTTDKRSNCTNCSGCHKNSNCANCCNHNK
ncbi:hypothetical protein FDF74_06545 [Clostridium niameyense]|uniref:Uncharacterized protein n=1 Tax=Clostridium niameyense TaxID=1622073 RepID=A0A6M0R9E6_9CLOT|nr:hypothetical protein [Clostridium niameyense]NEZ46872.1 hypothetical protein [Clostridium niameyense]